MLPFMSPGMRHRLLYGGTVLTEGRYVNIKGANRANIPDQNLWARLRFTPQQLRKKDTTINLDMFKNEIKRLDEIDAAAGNVSVNFQKDIGKLQREFTKIKREYLNELEEFQGNKYWLGKGQKYSLGMFADYDISADLTIKQGKKSRKISPQRKIAFDKKIDELREKELKIIGSEREHKLSSMEARYPADRFENDLDGYAKTKAGINTYNPRKIKPKMPTTINRLRGSINRINKSIKEMQDKLDKYVAREEPRIANNEYVDERDVLRDIYKRSPDQDKFGDMEISVLFDDLDNIKITEAEWNRLYTETLAELRQNVKDGYFYAIPELEAFLETTKAQKRNAWKKLKKEFDEKADEIASRIGEELSLIHI